MTILKSRRLNDKSKITLEGRLLVSLRAFAQRSKAIEKRIEPLCVYVLRATYEKRSEEPPTGKGQRTLE